MKVFGHVMATIGARLAGEGHEARSCIENQRLPLRWGSNVRMDVMRTRNGMERYCDGR